jgi:hypothetical protein
MGNRGVLILLLSLQILWTSVGDCHQDCGTGQLVAVVLALHILWTEAGDSHQDFGTGLALALATSTQCETYRIAGEVVQKSHSMKCAEQSERGALMARMETTVDSDLVQEAEMENSSSKKLLEASSASMHLEKVGNTAGGPLKCSRKSMGQAAEKENKLDRLLQEVLSLIMRNPDASIIGVKLRGKTDEQKLRMVKNCVGGRIHTLAPRMSPIRSFISWVDVTQLSVDYGIYTEEEWKSRHEVIAAEVLAVGFPPTEEIVYAYMEQEVLSPSASYLLMRSLVFFQSVFGFDFSSLLESPRLCGLAAMRLGAIGPIRNARPFDDHTIPSLEIIATDEYADPMLYVAANNLLMMFLSRSRRSDWNQVTELFQKDGSLFVRVDRTKNSVELSREPISIWWRR